MTVFTMYMYVDQFNFHDSFTELGLTGRPALQKWDMTLSVVVVTVLLILSDYSRLSSAPVSLWDLFLYIKKIESYIYLKWKMYANRSLFPGLWQIILLFSHFWECAGDEFVVTAIVNVFVVWMTAPFFSLASVYICSLYTVRSCQCIWAF